jgi:hypothetical protein
LTHAVVAGLR